jgi:hypothetical protein
VRRVAAFTPAGERVAQADVAESAAHHDLVIASSRTERIEVAWLDAVLGQVATGRHVPRDRTGGRDVVCRDRVSEHHEAASVHDVRERLRLGLQRLEERRLAHVRRGRVPGEQRALRSGQRLPALVAVPDRGVLALEELGRDARLDGVAHLAAGRPEVAQEDVRARAVGAERVVLEIDVDRARQRVGDDERGEAR